MSTVRLSLYEARMLWRKRSSFVLVGLAVLVVLVGLLQRHGRGPAAVASWATLLMYVLPIGVGLLMSDRLVREREDGLLDLLAATPLPAWRRALSVAAGSFVWPYLLVVSVLLVIGAVFAVRDGDPAAFGAAVLLAVAVLLPGLAVATAVSWLLALLLPLAAARVLLVAFWLWACMLNPNVIPIPSPTGTLLSPLGEYTVIWLGGDPSYQGLGIAALSPRVTAGTAVLSATGVLALAALLTGAALALVNLNRVTSGHRWE